MTTLGKQIGTGEGNNLNAIRLILAQLVVFSHSFQLGSGSFKNEPFYEFTLGQEYFGSIAVDFFFLISGALITASWLRSKSMQDFLIKRVLRIYPAFIVAMLFSGAVVWLCCPEFRASAGHGFYWTKVLARDCIFLTDQSLYGPGIFANNPYPHLANASLWTIPIEFSCYLIVAIIGLFCLFKRRALILLVAAGIFLAYSRSIFQGVDVNSLETRFLTYFMLGVCVWLWRDRIPFTKSLALGSFVVLLIASQFKPWFAALLPVLGGYCVLWFGYGPNISFLNWTRKTDLSYGAYLYAFPVQQIVAAHQSLRNPWSIFLVAGPVTVLLAWLSWHWVESRLLALKRIPWTDFDPGEAREADVLTARPQTIFEKNPLPL